MPGAGRDWYRPASLNFAAFHPELGCRLTTDGSPLTVGQALNIIEVLTGFVRHSIQKGHAMTAMATARRCNAAGRSIIMSFEDLRLQAYRCPAGVLTIGYGHTGPDVVKGMTITKLQAEALLAGDLSRFERDVASLVKAPVTDNQFAALVSFAFNVGSDIDADVIPEGLGDSTLLKKLNAGDAAGAADEFLKWAKSGGQRLRGLVRRRHAERALFLTPNGQPFDVAPFKTMEV